jgi:Tfp pilus assembly pilus retraction ATPase PilT
MPSIIQASKGDGMVLMEDAILGLVGRGLVNRKAAISATGNPRLFDE